MSKIKLHNYKTDKEEELDDSEIHDPKRMAEFIRQDKETQEYYKERLREGLTVHQAWTLATTRAINEARAEDIHKGIHEVRRVAREQAAAQPREIRGASHNGVVANESINVGNGQRAQRIIKVDPADPPHESTKKGK